ncbi:hypothetical protein POJ06DRAFT_244309 [Lipomyces tetrasporus]|uniref:Uncharacterized protein n=1 Tax=Lipomyces tetrasporus TaxID=54092 RepID=A0AAD7QZZ4_9ASCO|nr:uncharacterized protein POJ06DRAFT_244309 [Lipomyces tetrasporus]KAJ8104358.1 hypothetical protein POJ06DRAFT_244309 [Lipomyces tetrasporus]
MLAQDNNELLIPPVVTIAWVTPPPPPSDPPTQQDVDRALLYKNMVESSLSVARCHATAEDVASSATYYVRVRERYEQSLGLGDITLADVVREFRQNFRDLNAKIDRMDQRITTMDQRITGKIDRLEEQMIRQVEATSVLVQNSVAGKDSMVQMSRQQAIEINRERSRDNRPGTEVPFLDGVIPSSRVSDIFKYMLSTLYLWSSGA